MSVTQPRYSKEERALAKERNLALFTIDIDDRHVMVNGEHKGRRHTVQGVLAPGWDELVRAADKATMYGPIERPAGERDLETLPYHELEARVAGYLVELTGIGAGDDPVGFLIASHAALVQKVSENDAR